MTNIPLKQRPAREQAEHGVTVPYWVTDLDGPLNYHLKLLLLTPEELDKLVLYARKEARRLNPNPHDNRGDNMEYPPTNRERVDCLRHLCLNRTPGNMNTLAGYSNSFDSLLSKIETWLKRGRAKEERALVETLVASGVDPIDMAAAALKVARAEEKQRPIPEISPLPEKALRPERRPRGERAERSERGGRDEANTRKPREAAGRAHADEHLPVFGRWLCHLGQLHDVRRAVTGH